MVRYYFSTEDYMGSRLSEDEVIVEVKEMGDDFIYASRILSPQDTAVSSTGKKAWAIHYDGKDFVNLNYSNSGKAPGMYIQVDVKGRFCLAVMELDFLKSLGDAENTTTAGLPKHIVDSKDAGGLRFVSKDSSVHKIYLVDTKDLSIVLPYKANNAPIDYLTNSTLKWLVGKENYRGKPTKYTVEEIIAIVEDLNGRQKL